MCPAPHPVTRPAWLAAIAPWLAGIAALWLAGVSGGCVPDSDPRWQLNHDRVVAARATPPHLPPGTSATIDALIAHAGSPTTIDPPVDVRSSPGTPAALAQAVAHTDAGWQVTAPGAEQLDAARASAKIAPGQPVPLVLIETFGPIPLIVHHTIFLGDAAANPTPGAVQVAGAAAAPDALVIARDVDVPLAIDADPAAAVNWLTSCGTMHDDDEHAAFVHVQPDDSQAGELVVVVRAADGGVGWRRWTIEANPDAQGE
jgi:hypothetical protein